MLETYLDEKVHLSSKIWLSEVEKPRIFHDFPANSLCKLHREFEGNQPFSTSDTRISELRLNFSSK